MNSKTTPYNNVTNFRLGYYDHISLIKKGSDSKSSRSYYVHKFRKILKSMVKTFNRLEPYGETLYYTIKDDCAYIRVQTKNQSTFKKLHLLIVTNNNIHYFAPWIYEYFQRSSRFVISKRVTTKNHDELSDDSQEVVCLNVEPHRKYLVHRSYPNRELQHPGGHLEYVEILVVPKITNYFESKSCSNDSESYHTIYNTAYDYTRSIILDINSGKGNTLLKSEEIDPQTLSVTTRNWAICGGIREVLEESGLDLREYLHQLNRINLLKIGAKAFYFGIEVDTDIYEEGPQPEFGSELISFESINSFSTANEMNFLADLDRFWIKHCNQETDHAWISALDMFRLWNPEYKDHILELMHNFNYQNN